MIVKEYWPGFVERDREPREQAIERREEALEIPWLKEKGSLKLDQCRVKLRGTGLVVAVIWPNPPSEASGIVGTSACAASSHPHTPHDPHR